MQISVIHCAFEEGDKVVALVDIPETLVATTSALEYAYRWTQNLVDSWSTKGEYDGNKNVRVIAELPTVGTEVIGLRSTSVGDRLVIGHDVYKILLTGFEKV